MHHFKLKPTANTSYFGGKSGAGTYQTIINQIPPHDIFVSGFLGHCAIMRHKYPAKVNIACELDTYVINDWQDDQFVILNDSFMEGTWLGYNVNPSKKYFLYIDPPYPLESRKSDTKVYKYEMTTDDHINLLHYLLKLRCNIAISTYPNALYAKYLKRWRCIEFKSSTRHGLVTELLYMNYPPPTKLHDYSFIGKDYRQRERWKKKHKSLTNKIAMLGPIQQNKLFNELRNTYKI